MLEAGWGSDFCGVIACIMGAAGDVLETGCGGTEALGFEAPLFSIRNKLTFYTHDSMPSSCS